MSLFRLAPLALVLILAAGCDSSEPAPTPPPPPPVEIRILGRYTGTANVGGTAVSIESTLSETNNVVSGSGTLTISNAVAISATGSHVQPDFNITFRATNLEDLNFAGTANGDASVLRGTLNGSGFSNVAITLTRPSGRVGNSTASARVAPITEIPPGVTTFRELLEMEAK